MALFGSQDSPKVDAWTARGVGVVAIANQAS